MAALLGEPPGRVKSAGGPFTPRGLIVQGVMLHVVISVFFWQLAGVSVFMWGMAITERPMYVFAASAVILSLGGLIVTAWRRQSWLLSGIVFAISLLSLPWPLSVFYLWQRG